MPIKLAICNSKVAPGFADKIAKVPAKCGIVTTYGLQPTMFNLVVLSPVLQRLQSKN